MFLFRTVHELLLNVVKHAGTNTVAVRLDVTPARRLRIELRDRGRGFDPDADAPRGLGLFRVRERAATFGGSLRVVSAPGAGTRVSLTVPLA
jgi:signal transduction histidine kinase